MSVLARARQLCPSLALVLSLPVCLGLGLSPLAAQATTPAGTLTFIQPTGTALATDNIDVWVRLTLNPDSEPLNIAGGVPLWAYSVADFNTSSSADHYLSVTSVNTNVYFSCNSTFTNVCGEGAYGFEFNTTGMDGFYNLRDIFLAPGASYDYLFGTFKPVGGAAPAGTYTFYNSGAIVQVTGRGHRAQHNPDGSLVTDPVTGATIYEPELDANGTPVFDSVQKPVHVPQLDGNGAPLLDATGNPLYEQATDPITGELLFVTELKPRLAIFDLNSASVDIASNACGPGGSCTAFTREVSAVPEASTLSLSIAGLLLMGATLVVRRRV
jgi:hypothetical protein